MKIGNISVYTKTRTHTNTTTSNITNIPVQAPVFHPATKKSEVRGSTIDDHECMDIIM